MAETAKGTADDQKNLLDVDLEVSDRTEHSTEVAAIVSEIRALTGQTLHFPRNGILQRLGIRGPQLAHRVDAIQQQLTGRQASNFIHDIVGHLYAGSRRVNAGAIESQLRNRFQNILNQRLHQGGTPTDQVARSVVVGRALLDAVYEHVKGTDIVHLATNIASQIPDIVIQGAAPAGVTADMVRNHFYDQHDHCLTQHGRNLLDRLRKGGANPGKVLLAFSAAVDHQHFNPEIPNLVLDTVAPLPGGRTRRNLLSAVLEAPAAGMDANVYRRLEQIAKALEKYEGTPETSLKYIYPNNPTPAGHVAPRDSSALVELQKSQDKYDTARNLQQAVRDALDDLRNFIAPGSVAVANHPYQGLPLAGIDTAITQLNTAVTTTAGTNPNLHNATAVRRILTHAFGGNIETAEEYKERAGRADQVGLTGTDACNKILAEYIGRVGDVDDVTAKQGLASLTGRVKIAEQLLRQQREELNIERPSRNPRRERNEFNRKHEDARHRFFGLRLRRLLVLGDIPYLGFFARFPWLKSYGFATMRSPLVQFQRELNREECIGLREPLNLTDENANSLESLTVRYFTLRYLSKIIPKTDDKRIPLSALMAEELMRLKRAIVERQLRNISKYMARKHIDKLKKEDVESMGLAGSNIEDLPFDEMQDRLYAMLNANALPHGMKEKVDAKVALAWEPIEERQSETRTEREARTQRFNSFIKKPSFAVGNFAAWPFKKVYGGVKGVGRGIKGMAGWFWGKATAKKTFWGGGSGGGH